MLRLKKTIVFFFCCILAACSSDNYAPVTDLSYAEAVPSSGTHRVRAGETLYEIAWRYGLDYRYIAQRNHIDLPYTIFAGQVISLNERSKTLAVRKIKPEHIAARPTKEPEYASTGWICPAHGSVINLFSLQTRGINIAGRKGQPIYAAASGKVVYSGNGLRGYGNLIIIKHNSLFLSAYAHNTQIFVKEGNWVRKGQKIAGMGNTGTDKIMLHFEIRRAGKPINPLLMLTC